MKKTTFINKSEFDENGNEFEYIYTYSEGRPIDIFVNQV